MRARKPLTVRDRARRMTPHVVLGGALHATATGDASGACSGAAWGCRECIAAREAEAVACDAREAAWRVEVAS